MKEMLKNIYKIIRNNVLLISDLIIISDPNREISICESFININELNIEQVKKEVAEYLCSMYLKHRFDILGSGWVSYGYNSEANGFHNVKYKRNLVIKSFDKKGVWLKAILLYPHRKLNRKIWAEIKEEYIPIDWQKDVKSGYRWSTKKWYKDQKIAPLPGVDIKIPWELGRLQHLPQLAIFCLVNPTAKKTLITEFKNIVLDFIVANPPRMGVCWTSTMDVAIRAINLLIAYDLFTQLDNWKILNEKFKSIFRNSIYEHGKHIVNNLEYSTNYTNNHYLSNIVGLIVISRYISGIPEIEEWRHFATKEFVEETYKQFNQNGTNYEGATAYHCLSSEMVLIALGFIKNLPGKIYSNQKLDCKTDEKTILQDNNEDWCAPKEVLERIYKAGCYLKNIIKPNGEIPQIGDNDSGRIVKLMEVGKFITKKEAIKLYVNLNSYEQDEELYWDANCLNYEPLLAYWDGIFENNDFQEYSKLYPLEASFTSSLVNHNKIQMKLGPCKIQDYQENSLVRRDYEYQNQTEFIPESYNELKLTDQGYFLSYEECGVFLYKSKRVYLLISARTDKSKVIAGHLHNDVSSFELDIDGKHYALDPGAYVYTAHIPLRNEYRSTIAHNVIRVDSSEQNTFSTDLQSLFSMKSECLCKMVNIGDNFAEFEIKYKNVCNYRKFEILPDKVIVIDKSNKPFKLWSDAGKLYSCGYGKLKTYNI